MKATAAARQPATGAFRPGPLQRLRSRLRAWLQGRLPVSDTLLLTQGNVYILPTRPGLMFALTLLVLLLASINYRLNLGYLLTFLLAGAGIAGMYLTHGTLRGLTLHLKQPAPVFCGDAAMLEVTLTSAARRPRYGIGLRVLREDRRSAASGWSWTDVPPESQALAHVAFQPQRRGRHRVPSLTAETRFPLGIFRVWAIWRPAAELLVYPAPEMQAPPLPGAQPMPGGPVNARHSQGGETEGVRAYRRGDPLKLVVWKKVAKSDEMVSRDTSAAARQELWIDYQLTGGADLERRLSRLTAWVLSADRLGMAYGLRLPGHDIAPDHGEAHRRRCLEQLALYA
ncbi:DUF58 domain-containing protein [Aquabacterium sp. A7-Y]|uniref:DUF58 domain-containing protein n=1 Tax=Aquabacterium sp. A7-Y TaxID=1349605 RepID=UPI00223D7AFD|nr:DUF58 domain-containing protein [Aquabacterium sp. A7-Y]MCW7538181.1 DUF58 domain-containing protein [Aquabacterium sp. A7-Y]